MSYATLGWTVLEWMHEVLPSPSDPSKPLVLTEPQARFVLDWYMFDRETGEFVYRRGAWQAPKGAGKSPLGAALALAEFAAPVLPAGFDAQGRPVGRRWGDGDGPAPWVQIAALAEEQASSNIYAIVYEMLTVNGGRTATLLGIDEGRTRLYRKDRPASKLEAVTSAAGTREGQRVTFAVLDETHLWTPRNGGAALARTIRRNAGKTGGRTLELSNAPEIGEGSVAEETMGQVGEPGILFHAPRPPAEPDLASADGELLPLLTAVYAGSPWVDTRRILAEVRDPATPPEEALRYYFNVPVAAADGLVSPARWAELAMPRRLEEGEPVGVGFDGSYSHDATALVLCTLDGHLHLRLLLERGPQDPGDWRVPRHLVHEAVHDVFRRYDVRRMLCDPWRWHDEVDEWAEAYGAERVLVFPTNSVRRMGPAVDRFRTALAEGRVHHPGDPDLTRHVLAARLRKGRGRASDGGHGLYTLDKPDPGRFIDAAVAAVLAYEAAATAPAPAPARTPVRLLSLDDDLGWEDLG